MKNPGPRDVDRRTYVLVALAVVLIGGALSIVAAWVGRDSGPAAPGASPVKDGSNGTTSLGTQIDPRTGPRPDFTIEAGDNSGAIFRADIAGEYRFRIRQGHYCTSGSSTLCRTAVRGYQDNRPIDWGTWKGNPDHPINESIEIGCYEDFPVSCVGSPKSLLLGANEIVRWVIMDERRSFSNNTGTVTIAVDKVR